MSTPKRIQLSRQKGFRLPPDVINVARPTRWGNPFKVYEGSDPTSAVDAYRSRLFSPAFDSDLRIAIWTLRGHDLACWCKPDEPCHADVLLKVVNDPRAEPLMEAKQGDEVVIMGRLSRLDRVPDSIGWGSFEFSHVDKDNFGGGIYHSGMGPVYSPAVLDLCAGKEAA